MKENIIKLREMVEESNNIVFFGGAGVSTESNIPDFRSSTGIYTTQDNRKYQPEYMLSHTCFLKDTEDFYEYYRENMIHLDARPNKAHKALSKLEEEGKLKAVITQNIDGLHQKAGSKEVLELHGTIMDNYCTECGKYYGLDYILNTKGVPYCSETNCRGIVKPDVVLYEEQLDNTTMARSIDYIKNADLLIVGGTSLRVYPAAGFIDFFEGENLVLINKTNVARNNRIDLFINDSIGKVLDSLVD